MNYRTLKSYLLILIMIQCLAGCKKIKEDVIEEVALNMLDGTEWKIVHFHSGSNDLTADFTEYRFRFNRDETVTAIRSNTPSATGTWRGNMTNRTMFANFAATTVHPLPMLNATWTITQSTMQSLSANTAVGTELRQLRMEKL